MKIKKIDKLPPSPSGETKRDLAAMLEYLCYLREQINFALEQQERRIGALEEKE